MRERLRALLEELEDINLFVQNGCIDPHHLAAFKGYDSEDHEKLMSETDRLTAVAYSAIEDLTEMTKEKG